MDWLGKSEQFTNETITSCSLCVEISHIKRSVCYNKLHTGLFRKLTWPCKTRKWCILPNQFSLKEHLKNIFFVRLMSLGTQNCEDDSDNIMLE